jgi:hypothetical protein
MRKERIYVLNKYIISYDIKIKYMIKYVISY